METMLFFGAILRSYFARNILNFDIFDFKNHGILTADYFSVYLNKYDLPGHEISLKYRASRVMNHFRLK